MEVELWYHGSPGANIISDVGFDIHHQRRNDPGDFGWGIYVVRSISRARAHGTLLGVMVDVSSCAYIPNPYFLDKLTAIIPTSFEEQLFYDIAFDASGKMLTLKGNNEEREIVCKEIQQSFLQHGYTGILSDYQIGEMVIFDPRIIQDVFLME